MTWLKTFIFSIGFSLLALFFTFNNSYAAYSDDLKVQMPVLYDYLNSQQHVDLTSKYSDMIVTKTTGTYLNMPYELYNYYYFNKFAFRVNSLGEIVGTDSTTDIAVTTYYHKNYTSAPYIKSSDGYINVQNFTLYSRQKYNIDVIYSSNGFKDNTTNVQIIEKGGNIDPLVPVPLSIVAEVLPEIMNKEVGGILSQVLIIFAILLAVGLVPRLVPLFLRLRS